MHFFPSEHIKLTTTPLNPTEVIARIKSLTEKDKFKGTFLINMFNIQYTPKVLFGIKIPFDPLVTGYFSTDKKNIILDYNMSKMGKLKMLCLMFILPIIFILSYMHFVDTESILPYIYAIFYTLSSILIYLVNIIIFKIKQKKIHNKLLIQILY